MLFSLQPLAFYEPSVYFSIFKQALKFYSIFFKKLRGRGAVRQRKFGFQTKLPGRKRPSSGVFSDLRSEARHPPRRPLSLPCGRGVGDPSPQAPPRQARRISYFLNLKFYSIFFKKLRGRGAEPPPPRARGGTLYPVKRFFRVNCREAARGGFLQEKKPPFKHTEPVSNRKGPGRIFPPKAPPEAPAPRETPLRSGFPFG